MVLDWVVLLGKGKQRVNPKNNPEKKAISNMKQRKKIPVLPSSVLNVWLPVHSYTEKIAKQSNSNNKKHTKQASSREKKPKH